jgi:hypothetical protein
MVYKKKSIKQIIDILNMNCLSIKDEYIHTV